MIKQRLAFLTQRRRRGLWLGATLSLGLALAAASVVFALVDSVLLHPLPYPDQDRIVLVLRKQGPEGVGPPVSGPAFADLSRQQDVFSHFAASAGNGVVFTGSGLAQRWVGVQLSRDWFGVIGSQPLLGRYFQDGDITAQASPVAVLSHTTWTTQFGADPAVLGRVITLNGKATTVVGVAPKELLLPGHAAVALPLVLPPGNGNRGNNFLRLSGRLKPGVGLDAAQARFNQLAAGLAAAFPDNHAGLHFEVQRMNQAVTARARSVTALLGSAALLLVLVGSASFVNLALADAYARRRELATRQALGAANTRLLRQIGAELISVLMLTAAFALGLGWAALRWLAALNPDWLARPEVLALGLPAVLATVAVATMVGAATVAVVAGQVRRGHPVDALRGGARGGMDPVRQRIRRGLVVVQIALSLVLLIGAGLLTASLSQVLHQDPGFDSEGLLTLRLGLPIDSAAQGTGGADDSARVARSGAFLAQVEATVREVPGVRDAGVAYSAPLVDGSGYNGDFSVVGDRPPAAGQAPLAEFQFLTPRYFSAMGLELLSGRMLAGIGRDDAGQVLINDAMAQRYFAGRDPVGLKLNVLDEHPHEIVGVVRGVRQNGLDDRVRPEVYFGWQMLATAPDAALVVRTALDPAALGEEIRQRINRIDASVPVYRVTSMRDAIDAATAKRRFLMQVTQFFGLAGLVIAVVGLYAVLSHAVAQRTSEFGVRMALGASARSVLAVVAGEGARTLALGVAIGLVSALAASRLLASELYGVSASDPAVFGLLCLLLIGIAQIGLLIPAWRASRVAPVEALRYE